MNGISRHGRRRGGRMALGCAMLAMLAMSAMSAIAAMSAAVRATAAAPRLVSLSPHITELLFAAGAGGYVVGVDDATDYPPAALGITHLGEPAGLDIERLLHLAPSTVILWDSGTPPRVREELDRLHLHVVATEQRRLDDIGDTLEAFGRLAGTTDVAAAAAGRYRAELAALRAQYAGRARLAVFFQVWDKPLYTLSGTHVVSEVLSLCGGDNIFADLSTLAPAVDREAVLARDPAVILIEATAQSGTRQADAWRRFPGLRAVRDGNIYSVDPTLISRMAPRILDGIRQVCTALDRARTAGPRLH